MPDEVDKEGNPLVDDSLIILLNSSSDHISFKMPEKKGKWQIELDTKIPDLESDTKTSGPGETVEISGRSVILLRNIS